MRSDFCSPNAHPTLMGETNLLKSIRQTAGLHYLATTFNMRCPSCSSDHYVEIT